MTSHFSNSSDLASALYSNAGSIFDISKDSDVNPLLVIIRAIIEGNSPGPSKNNYWGY